MAELTWAQSFFGDRDEEPTVAPTSFGYAPELIGGLQTEHRGLLRRFAELEKLVGAKRFDAIPHNLAAFKSKFNVHMLRENLHCYGYLEQGLTGRPADLATARKFRGEIDTIARGVLDFIERFQREERELFVLYKP